MKLGTFVVLFGKFFITVAEQTNSESDDSGWHLDVGEPHKEDKKEVKISRLDNFINKALPQKDDQQEEKNSLEEYYINKSQIPPQREEQTEPDISNDEPYNNKAPVPALKDDKKEKKMSIVDYYIKKAQGPEQQDDIKEPKMSSDEYNINKVQGIPRNDDVSVAKMAKVEYYIKEAKTVVDKANELIENSNFRRDFTNYRHTKFTDFILHLIKILKQYDDKDLEDFVAIVNDEIRKYHYRGCKFHELINNHGFRRFMSKKLDVIKTMSARDIRHGLEAISTKLEQGNYSKMEKELVDFVNSLYKRESVHNFNTVLINVDNYRMKSRRFMNLIEIIREGIRSVIFDHFTDLNTNVRVALKTKLDEFWDYLVGISASFIMQNYLTRLKLSDQIKLITNELSDEKVKSVEIPKDSSSNECNIARNRDDNSERDHLKHTFKNNYTKSFNTKGQKTHHNRKTSKQLRVPTTPRHMYVESVDSEADSRELHNINKDKDPGKKNRFTQIDDDPTTLRQMYFKEIDSKYNMQSHVDSTEFRGNGADYKNKVHNVEAKGIERPTTPRERFIKSMALKYPQTKHQQEKDKHSANFRSNDKHQHSHKQKHFKKTTYDPTTLRQMFLEHINSKRDSRFMKLRSKDKNLLDIGKNDATTIRQMYLESIKFNDSLARNTETKKRKSKINTLIDMNPSYKVLYSENMQRLLKSTDEPSTPRRVQAEIMHLQIGPGDRSTELINKDKITHTTTSKGNIRIKNKLRHRRKHNHTKNSKEHKKHNMFIDLDPKFLNQRHFQLKTTKNARTLRQRYLENAKKALESSGAATRQINYGVKEKLTYTNKQNKNQIEEKKAKDLRVDKKQTLGNPTTMNVIEEHNTIIKFNKMKTPKPWKTSELKHNTSNKELTAFSPVYNTIPRRQTLMDLNIQSAMPAKSKRMRKPLKTTENTTDHKFNITADRNMSEEGLSIEDLNHSHRRMGSKDPADSLLNDTAVLTKIRQLENEIKVVKTKLENDTDIIENLNNKICETENRLKEFCNQEFRIVRANINIPIDDRSIDSRADINANDEKPQGDKSNEYNPKRFPKARSQPNEVKLKSKNTFISSSVSNKYSKVVTKKIYKETNNFYDENTANIPDRALKMEADIDSTSTKAVDMKPNSVSVIDKLTTKDDIKIESELNKNKIKKEITTQVELQKKDKVNSNKGNRDDINNIKTYETSKNIENNKVTFGQNSEIINSKQSDSDTDDNSNVHLINENVYSAENDNFKTESKIRAKFSRKGNNKISLAKGQCRKGNDLRREYSQDITNHIHKSQAAPFIRTPKFIRRPDAKSDMKSFIRAPTSRRQLKKDEEDEKKEAHKSEIQRMINNSIDKDGDMMDIERMHEMEGQMFRDMPDSEADPIVQWLNLTSTKATTYLYK